MNDAKKAALAAIDEKKELVAEVADAIWDYAELSMQEVKSAALFVKVLKAEGFQVEEGYAASPPPSPPPSAAVGRSLACWRSTMRCPAFRRRRAAPRTTNW